MDTKSLKGKIVLVTGAASGIGAGTAIVCARRGADLILLGDINQEGLRVTREACERLGSKVMARRVDVSKRDQVDELAREVHGEVEAIDILVNNAGVALAANFLETTIQDWEKILGTNLFGCIHHLNAFLPPMIARNKGGHIVNVSAGAAFAPMDVNVAYAASKAAIVALSEGLRMQLEPHGIGVTAVCPGFVNTPAVETMERRGRFADPKAKEAFIQFFKSRGCTPEQAAEEILVAIKKNKAIAPISSASGAYYIKRFLPQLMPFIIRKMEAKVMAAAKDSAPS